MGSNKALLPMCGKPLLVRVIETILAAGGIDPIVVVTGHEAERIVEILRPLAVHPLHNPAYATGGMLSSVQKGVAAVEGRCEAFFVVLGDHPLVRPQTLTRMCNAWAESHPAVLLPSHDRKHGHPILLSADGAGEILSLSPQRDTLKTYTSKRTEHTLELAVDDPGVLADIDTPADYQAAVDRTARQ